MFWLRFLTPVAGQNFRVQNFETSQNVLAEIVDTCSRSNF